ncbi:MAG TPA: glutamate-5-semialdehyde dehydrogenase [Thermoanaerobaculia bacterium]
MSTHSSAPSGARPAEVARLAAEAKRAARELASVPVIVKDRALERIAVRLGERETEILEANALDVGEAEKAVAGGMLAKPLLDRLRLDSSKLAGMIAGVRAVKALDDPSGKVLARTLLDDGLELRKVTCPLGLLAVIFESRPDAVTQISALAIKSGNAVILKGGREAARTTAVLVAAIREGLRDVPEVPEGVVESVADRAEVDALLALDGIVDLVIPRGSNELVRSIQARTRIPVLGHAEGVCHVYVDAAADPEMAARIALDAKLQYVAACNAAETLLVHRDAAVRFLAPLLRTLGEAGIQLRGCPESRRLAPGVAMVEATEADWRTEYSAPVLAVRVVESVDEAIAHVNEFGSGHTDTIVTEDATAAERFLERVDAAGVYHNASTRFADGYRYGFGAEVGISTSKIHARGPVGLEGLVTTKYKLYGSGQVVADYSGPNARPFLHRKLDKP